MREQLEASRQRVHKRARRSAYWRSLSIWFRWGKLPLSELANRARAETPWPSFETAWQDLDDYASWLARHVRWKKDPLWGAFDTFLSPEAMAAQMRDKGRVEKDCDGLAHFSALNLRYLLDDDSKIYIVTLILDPFSFQKERLLYAAHVLCVFKYDDAWRVISNGSLYPTHFASFAQAVQHNPYCASHPVLWFEVRDTNLKRLHAGADLDGFSARLEK